VIDGDGDDGSTSRRRRRTRRDWTQRSNVEPTKRSVVVTRQATSSGSTYDKRAIVCFIVYHLPFTHGILINLSTLRAIQTSFYTVYISFRPYFWLPTGHPSGQHASISYTQWSKNRFFAPHGRQNAPIKVKFGTGERTVPPCQISPLSGQKMWKYSPRNCQSSEFCPQICPSGLRDDPFAQFLRNSQRLYASIAFMFLIWSPLGFRQPIYKFSLDGSIFPQSFNSP